jgi:homoserine dehydrogenase
LSSDASDLDGWREALAAAPATGPVTPASAPALLDRLARLPRPILVDLTAADGMEEVYAQAFRRGIDVVGANKRPLAVAPRALDELRALRRQHHRHHHYDAAVGASLPVLGTLRRVVRSGDRLKRVEGALSGTLGFLATELARGVPLSLATRWAIGLGYCEEDPRDDLSGLDTARKALILARELGASLALEDVKVEPFVPPRALAPGTPEELLAALRSVDEEMAARVERLRGEGKVLRYLARLEERSDGGLAVSVGPVEVDGGELPARLVGVEAYVAFTTARHAGRPLVVPAGVREQGRIGDRVHFTLVGPAELSAFAMSGGSSNPALIASKKSCPMPGHMKIRSMMMEPLRRAGNERPIKVTSGINVFRKACLTRTVRSGSPFARAVRI